ncbi:MAG: gamma-glutamyltransferase, partial [Rhodospirillaceae bacterium]|nr:gamma-glutamyltransferase [Rhodospirillaceae bacterium]
MKNHSRSLPRSILIFVVGVFLLAACQHEGELVTSNQAQNDEARATPEAATAPSAKAKPKSDIGSFTNPANNTSAEADKYMVAAANPLAAKAGLEILRAGGSAVDAVIATQLALNVVEPQSSGIGGGAFLLHYRSSSRAIEAYDGREMAPAAATGDMFLKPDGSRPNFHDVVPGGLSVGVPGVLRMMELAHKKHGKLPWAKLFEPAIKLADEGFDVSPRLYTLVKIDRHLKKFDASTNFFYDNAGFSKPVGTRLINKPLADTFRQIAAGGADAFYTGAIAADIVKTVRGAAMNPGRMTAAD